MHVTNEPGLKMQDVEIRDDLGETINPTGWPKPTVSQSSEPPKIPRYATTLDPRFFKPLDTRTKKQKEKAKRKAKLAKIARKKNRNK